MWAFVRMLVFWNVYGSERYKDCFRYLRKDYLMKTCLGQIVCSRNHKIVGLRCWNRRTFMLLWVYTMIFRNRIFRIILLAWWQWSDITLKEKKERKMPSWIRLKIFMRYSRGPGNSRCTGEKYLISSSGHLTHIKRYGKIHYYGLFSI